MFEIDKKTKNGISKKHALLSIVITAILLAVSYYEMPMIIEFFKTPDRYFNFGIFKDFTVEEFHISMLSILFYVAVTFFGYILYLLLTSGTRSELVANYKVKDLSGSRAQLEELYENAPVPYFTINKDGLIVGCNKSALRFFGVVPAEIAGKPFFSFAYEEDLELGEKLFNYFKSDAPINKQEIRMITKDFGIKWVSLSIFLTNNFSTGEKNGLVTTFDLTEQKQLDQAKTEFVSLASHQLRAPLATVKWFTEMLASGDLGSLNEKQQDYIRRMSSVNSDMLDLVETLLNVSRTEIGTLKIEKEDVNIVAIVDDILLELESQIKKRQIKINKNFKEQSINIESDPRLIKIVIQNLILNSIKYNKDGGLITIDFDDKSNRKTISVTDTGLGIPKEDQNRVFSKMFRARNVQNIAVGQSTGLGLYLVKSLIESMGGNISFVSEENVGSTFTLGL